MGKPTLDWVWFPEDWLAEVCTFVSAKGGTVSFMFGGEGYYYKLSWQWKEQEGEGQVRGMASGKAPADVMRLVSSRLFGMQPDAD